MQLRQELFYSVRKLDVLQELIEDETVTEIMVNGPDSIFVERKGKLTRWPKSLQIEEKLEDVIQQIVGKCNRIVNESSPIVDARLENGARVNVVVAPVALNGPILTIRRFPEHPITMEKLIALGSITPECASFLEKLVRARYSIVIGGGNVRMRMVKSGYNHCINGRMGVVWCLWSLSCTEKNWNGRGGKIMIRQKVDYGKYRYSQKEIFEIYRRKCSIVWCCRLFVLSNTLGNVACGSGFCVLSEVEEETDDQRKKTPP